MEIFTAREKTFMFFQKIMTCVLDNSCCVFYIASSYNRSNAHSFLLKVIFLVRSFGTSRIFFLGINL